MSVEIVLDEAGLEISNNDMAVHINKNLSFLVTVNDGQPFYGVDVRDLIDAAKLVEPVLVERYGGYR